MRISGFSLRTTLRRRASAAWYQTYRPCFLRGMSRTPGLGTTYLQSQLSRQNGGHFGPVITGKIGTDCPIVFLAWLMHCPEPRIRLNRRIGTNWAEIRGFSDDQAFPAAERDCAWREVEPRGKEDLCGGRSKSTLYLRAAAGSAGAAPAHGRRFDSRLEFGHVAGQC